MPDIQLIRSRRKTLSIEIKPDCSVIVRAPMTASNAAIQDFIRRHQSWLETHLARTAQRMAAHPEPSQAEKEALIQAAKDILPKKTAYYAAQMGLRPTGITITGAKTRFGSCSPKNRICYSWRLMQYPEPAIDYVVVHELAHIVHKNHGPQFHALVASILPDHLERRALLKK